MRKRNRIVLIFSLLCLNVQKYQATLTALVLNALKPQKRIKIEPKRLKKVIKGLKFKFLMLSNLFYLNWCFGFHTS